MATQIKSVSISSAGIADIAVDFANKLAKSNAYELFEGVIAEHIDSKEISGQTSLRLYEIIDEVFSSQEIVALPFPDTTKEDVAGTTDNPDHYEVATGEYNAKNEPKVLKGRVSHDITEQLPFGALLRLKLQQIQAVKDNKQTEDNPFCSLSGYHLDMEKNKYSGRLNYARSATKEAIKIAKVMHAFKAISDKVTVTVTKDVIGKDDTGNPVLEIRRTRTPIAVSSVADMTKFKVMSPSTFTSINVKAVIEAGGDFDAVNKIIARGNKNGGAPGAAGPKMAKDLNEVHDFANRVTTFFDQLSDDGMKRIANLDSMLSKKGGEELAYALGELCLMADSVLWPRVSAMHAKVAAELRAKLGNDKAPIVTGNQPTASKLVPKVA